MTIHIDRYLEQSGAGDLEKVTQKYFTDLMQFPGMYVSVQINRLNRTSLSITEERVIALIKQEVIERTIEMLNIMGIEFHRNVSLSIASLMIIEKRP